MLNVLSWALVFYSGLPSPFHYFFSVRRFCFLLLNWELTNVYVTVAVSPSIPLQCPHDRLLGKPRTRVHRRRPCYIPPTFWSNLLRVCRQLPRNYFWLSRRWQLNNSLPVLCQQHWLRLCSTDGLFSWYQVARLGHHHYLVFVQRLLLLPFHLVSIGTPKPMHC